MGKGGLIRPGWPSKILRFGFRPGLFTHSIPGGIGSVTATHLFDYSFSFADTFIESPLSQDLSGSFKSLWKTFMVLRLGCL